MKNEELNRELTEELQAELDEYRKEFLKLPKEEMLAHFEEYFNRYMIVKSVPQIDDDLFDPKYYKVILANEKPLDLIAQAFDRVESDWSSAVEDVIMELAAPDEYDMLGA